MKRLIIALAALAMLGGDGASPDATADAAEAECCWAYCEAYRDVCKILFRADREYCDAWYQGCLDGCKYPGGSTSDGGGGGAY